ncbi:MAG: hypothetical protein LKG17_03445, partial [Megasphaera sp.]|nr:hypothetical protein [Megasphaera sp.]
MKQRTQYFTAGALRRKVLKTLAAGMVVLPMAAAGSIVEASTMITSGTHDIGGEYTIDRNFARALDGTNIVLNGTDNVKITDTSTEQGFFSVQSGGKISLDMQGHDFAYEGKYSGIGCGKIGTPTSTWYGTVVIDNVHDFDAAIVASEPANIITAIAYGGDTLFDINATGEINIDETGSMYPTVVALSDDGYITTINISADKDINISGDDRAVSLYSDNTEGNIISTNGNIHVLSRNGNAIQNKGGLLNIKGKVVTIDALTKGIDASGGTTNVTATKGDVTIGNATAQAIHAEGTGSVDITSEQGKINLTATKTDNSTYPNAGIYTADTGAVNLHSDTVITAAEKSIDATGGTVAFDKALTAIVAPTAIAASGGAVVTATDGATDKQIAGTITADGSGTAVNVAFPTSASYFTGSTDVTNDGAVNLGFSNHSLWNLTADSKLTSLDNTNSTINMHYTGDDTYETITTDTYSGSNGTLLMDTDLASETNGDKLYINNSGTGGGTIQVFDKSLNSGTKVSAKDDWTKTKLLLVGGNGADGTTWTGQTLDTGGLWELTPTVEKLEDNQWYLTMMKRSANPSTKTIMGSLDSAYGLWRYDDTLRKRLGDLRYIDDDQN